MKQFITNIWTVLVIIIFFSQTSISVCQDHSTHKNQIKTCSKPSIKWIDEISSKDFSNKKEGFFSSILSFITGKEEIIIVKPFCNYVTDSGSLFLTDADSKSLIFIDKNKKEIHFIQPEDLKFESPVGLCSSGEVLLITDSQENVIFKYDYESEEITTLNISLKQPTGIAYIKSKKEFWVSETKNHRIVRLDKNGNEIGTLGKRGIGHGEFNYPTFIWADNKGKIYINDAMNFRIQILSEDGEFISTFGKAGDGSGDFASPKGIATDSYGHIYVADAVFNNIQVFNQAGQLLYVFGGRGNKKGEFLLPEGMYIDKENKIYIADSFNSRIQVFQFSCDD